MTNFVSDIDVKTEENIGKSKGSGHERGHSVVASKDDNFFSAGIGRLNFTRQVEGEARYGANYLENGKLELSKVLRASGVR